MENLIIESALCTMDKDINHLEKKSIGQQKSAQSFTKTSIYFISRTTRHIQILKNVGKIDGYQDNSTFYFSTNILIWKV
jgi:hypothetical protein